ncbi:hypothetical protein [Aeromicrobium sp.]|uniref:hypothetical protein n=1 Tax=Aeromicrobium sp. TaxID=1871063 RepID=UPI0030BF2620
MPVRIVSLGDPEQGFFRPVRAPYSLISPSPPADTLEARVFASIDDLEAGLSEIAAEVDLFHTQDCISRAAARVRTPARTCVSCAPCTMWTTSPRRC